MTMARYWWPVSFLVALGVLGAAVFFARDDQKVAPRFRADSTPAPDESLPASPVAITVNFTTDVTEIRSFTLSSGKGAVITDSASIDELPTTVRLPLTSELSDGSYTVQYEVCFADTTCEGETFGFAIDRSLLADFDDQRGKASVTVDLAELRFSPQKLLISTGTTVTWKNSDPVEHYVNTESHPYHTYVLDQNSRALGEGSEFSYTFSKAGAYPYHCSAHADQMTGMIVVDGQSSR